MTAGHPARVPVVALVASAGGLDALARVLGPLPADLPAAVLVAQHLDPFRASHLTSILAERTALRVAEARDGDALAPGVVLVVPAGRHLLLTPEQSVVLVDSGPLPPARPSADLLLATLAVTCGPRALAVVLTGKGTDAQAGIRAVARCGGTVFAQDEATSAHFGMPGAAIGTGLVHAVLPLSRIAGAVVDHVGREASLTAFSSGRGGYST
ncbi:chemotaxis protein CheB [Amycolatopsis vancoresmycina]|uniref:protein-glutamate methylesterase n=1 Tax=Amycolatopsis vancoresmycina DSM 44592 TaxID=1292037 RepID=R1HE55_9PSEU|nr:chemotaxis protein CheB [Amycolatopsis vancoresmycina]EOD58711.1 chemotaxis-specific methylesterase CheB [Amycolatopsis vancoresmycina DSM 44592]